MHLKTSQIQRQLVGVIENGIDSGRFVRGRCPAVLLQQHGHEHRLFNHRELIADATIE
jgi:hypothetical protein